MGCRVLQPRRPRFRRRSAAGEKRRGNVRAAADQAAVGVQTDAVAALQGGHGAEVIQQGGGLLQLALLVA